eukprot:scaffold5453_cov58-Phaeocystis_antarctica.AAC.1
MGGAGHGPGMGSPRDDLDDDGGKVQSLFEPNTANRPRSKIAISRSWRATTTGHATGAMRLFCKDLRRASVACSLFPPENITYKVYKNCTAHKHQSPSTGYAVHGKQATRAWSGVVGLGGDRLEVRARRLRRGKGVVCEGSKKDAR